MVARAHRALPGAPRRTIGLRKGFCPGSVHLQSLLTLAGQPRLFPLLELRTGTHRCWKKIGQMDEDAERISTFCFFAARIV